MTHAFDHPVAQVSYPEGKVRQGRVWHDGTFLRIAYPVPMTSPDDPSPGCYVEGIPTAAVKKVGAAWHIETPHGNHVVRQVAGPAHPSVARLST